MMTEPKDDCPYCDGTGLRKLYIDDIQFNEPIEYLPIECKECNGTGEKSD
ncbi:hypothetical protein ACWX0P_28090 [Vibrio mediterranei]|jgi:C4-type Zn-finger protein